MSLDLYREQAAEALGALAPVQEPEAGAFDGFLRGSGTVAMREFARAGRAIDMAGAVFPILQDRLFSTGTEAQDRYFKEHDEVFGSAVDYWTPRPGEVGIAAEVTGTLISMLPMVMASPGLAVGAMQLGTAEDLMKRGVSAEKAQKVGTAMAAGLGLGIWVPILGQNLWQRVLLGGVGFNVAQGVAMRGSAQVILEGSPLAEEFKAFDGTQLTLDVLLGAAFGTLVHVNPAARKQGAQFWERIQSWAEKLDPSQVDAIATLRQAQHMNVDSVPGKLVEPADVEAHVQRVRTAIDQLEKGQPVSVEELPAPKVEPDAARYREATAQAKALEQVAETVRTEEGIDPVPSFKRVAGGARGGEAAGAEPLPFVGKRDLADEEFLRDIEPRYETARQLSREGAVLESARIFLEIQRDIAKSGSRSPRAFILFMDSHIYASSAFDREAVRNAGPAVGIELRRIHKQSQDLRAKYEPERFEEERFDEEDQTAEAPAVPPRGGAEPPPPRGARGGEAAGAEAPIDPAQMRMAEATRFADEHPDLKLRVGTDADGAPIVKTPKQFLDDTNAEIARIQEQKNLLAVAAQCLFGMS